MKKLIFILILFITPILKAGEVGQYIIYTDSFSANGFTNMIKYQIEKSKGKRQPTDMVRWVSQVSTHTSANGIVRTNWRDEEPVVDEETDKIYMEIDTDVEGFSPVENFIRQGKIDRVNTYSYTYENGYNRDEESEKNIYKAGDIREDIINNWTYEVESSTD